MYVTIFTKRGKTWKDICPNVSCLRMVDFVDGVFYSAPLHISLFSRVSSMIMYSLYNQKKIKVRKKCGFREALPYFLSLARERLCVRVWKPECGAGGAVPWDKDTVIPYLTKIKAIIMPSMRRPATMPTITRIS